MSLVFWISNFFIKKNSQGRISVHEKSSYCCKLSFIHINKICMYLFTLSVQQLAESVARVVGPNIAKSNQVKTFDDLIPF